MLITLLDCRDEALAQEEYVQAQESWNHHLNLLHHRSGELQEHYEDQGGDIKVFFEVLTKSRDEKNNYFQSLSGPGPGPAREVEGGHDCMDIEAEDDLEDAKGTSESEDENQEDDVNSNLKVPHGFLNGLMEDIELPVLPKGFSGAREDVSEGYMHLRATTDVMHCNWSHYHFAMET